MKRNIFLTLFATIIAVALIQSCEPLEPSTASWKLYRIASVQYKDGKASLLIDYTGEVYKINNFSTETDMRHFNVQNGDRVIAEMIRTAVGNVLNDKLTLDRIVYKYPTIAIDESRPSDSLNLRYEFKTLDLGDITYPSAWAQGHIVNVTPVYIISTPDKVPHFHLYPLGVKSDTLVMQLYAEITDTITKWNSQQSLLCFDISTLRDSVPDPAEKNYRDSLMALLDAKKSQNITVQIFSADTLREKWLVKDSVQEKKYLASYLGRYFDSQVVSTSIPFDF